MTTEHTTQVPAEAEVAAVPLPQDEVAAPPVVPRWRRIACNPILRILIFVALAAAFSLLARWITGGQRVGLREMATASPLAMLGQTLRACVPIVLAYVLLVRVIEGRRIDELAWPKLLPHSAFGLLAGAGLMGLAAALMAATGSYRIEGVDASANLWFPLLMVGILGLVILALDIWAIISVFGSRAETLNKVLWILGIIVLPIVGFIAWLAFGPRASRA